MRKLFLLVALVISHAAFACYNGNPETYRDHGEIVDNAKSIVILKAAKSWWSCSLKVVRVIKGKEPMFLFLRCRLPEVGDWMTNFSNHNDERFWAARAGRLGIEPDCSLIPPAFEPGKYYVALFGIAPDTKQFEEIGSEDDAWLSFIENRVQGK